MEKNRLIYVFLIVIFLILLLLVIRLFSEKQLDDVSPGIPCDEELLNKADAYYIIPKFQNKSIAENKEWCSYILSKNKSLRMHGIYHIYNEFYGNVSEEDFREALEIFKECFGEYPKRFKAPQEAISWSNRKLIKKFGLNLDHYANAITHKIYHCNDSGVFSNRFIDFF